jgi:MinD-like ATPase involved in chromosome partitioning or flagellar assembly
MPNPLTIVVGGFDALATELAATGRFERVIPIGSTSALRAAIGADLAGKGRDDVVFFFADNLTVDTTQDLEFLATKLAAGGWKVVVCDVDGIGRNIVAGAVGAGMISGPFHLNKALGAMAGLGVTGNLEPLEDGFTPLDPTAGAASPAPAAPAEPAVTGGWSTPESTGFQPVAPATDAGGWSTPQTSPEPAAPAATAGGWGEPTAGADPAPRGGLAGRLGGGTDAASDWGTPVPGAAPAPFSGAGMPAPRAERMHTSSPTGRNGKCIVVTAPKGGVGKSSLTLNAAGLLAMLVADEGKTVCVVDTNFQNADTGKYLNNYRPTIKELAAEATSFTPQTIGKFLIRHPETGFSALLGPATPIEGTPMSINGKLYTRVLAGLREMFDYVIVDTPVAEYHHDIFDKFVLNEADYMIVAAAPNEATLLNISNWLKTITAARHSGGKGFDENKVGVFLNRAEEDIGCDIETVHRALASWTWLGYVPESKEWKRMNNRGKLVVTKNFPDINQPLTEMLAYVTRDPAVLAAAEAGRSTGRGGGGVLSKLLGRFR